MTRWTLLVPVKDLSRAKSRLVPPAGISRRDLALAFALDTVAAAAASSAVGRIVVVGDDPLLGAEFSSLPVDVVTDSPAGLNEALIRASSELPAGPRAALTGDLPTLTADDLDRALTAAGSLAYAVAADAQGTGTTLLAAQEPGSFRPRFGIDSLRAHVGDGAVALEVGTRLRADVDTAEDLAVAERLGVGPHTAALLARRAFA